MFSCWFLLYIVVLQIDKLSKLVSNDNDNNHFSARSC